MKLWVAGRLYPLHDTNCFMESLDQRSFDLIARVRLVLETAGVPPSGCAKALSSVLGVAIGQAYRKLRGDNPFTLPQIEAIEKAYGVQLLAVPACTSAAKTVRAWTDALFEIGGRELPCRIVLGSARKASNNRYAAFLQRGQWYVMLSDEYDGTDPLFDIDVMQLSITR